MKHPAYRPAALLLLIAVLLSMTGALTAGALERRVVRVGYPIQQGLTEKDSRGNYTGYTCEYLDEIAQYTGWEYEFVEVEGDTNQALSTLMDMLERGEIDLMGSMVYSDSMAEKYDYVGQSYGRAYTVLNVKYGDSTMIRDDYKSMQGMRVAVGEHAATRQAELAQFCETNHIEYEMVYCQNGDEQRQALWDGRADAILDVDMNLEYRDGLRTVARFAPRPFYFATTKGNAELVAQMNTAILTIDEVDPNFSTSLYSYYFGDQESELFFSEEERAYLADAGPLRVGFSMDEPPFQYMDRDTGVPKGIARDLMDYLSQETGLTLELVPTDTMEELETLAGSGQLDMVANMTYDHNLARRLNMSMTRPYLASQYVLILGPDVSELGLEGKQLALPASLDYDDLPEGAVQYDDLGQCLDAILAGDADYAYGNGYSAQYYVNQPRYRDIRLVPQTGAMHTLCTGVARSADPHLLTILNKVLVNIPDDTLQSIIYRNTIYRQDYSLRAMIEATPSLWAAILVGMAAVIIVALTWTLLLRIRRSQRDALELRKHYQLYALSNERFFEYDIRSDTLTLAGEEPDTDGRASVNHWRRDTPSLPSEGRERLGGFMDLIRDLEDGVNDLQYPGDDGVPIWLRLTTQRIYDEFGEPVYVVGKLTDIETEKRNQEALLDQARRDGLTGLYNPAASRALITEALSCKEGPKGALFILDIDHFKQVNDVCGHYTGDEVLQRLSAILQALFRREDVVGRLGGDEFLVYMDHAPDRETVERRCQTLMDKVHGMSATGLETVTVSVGAAMAGPDTDFDVLYKLADMALYQAKKSGRDGYYIA